MNCVFLLGVLASIKGGHVEKTPNGIPSIIQKYRSFVPAKQPLRHDSPSLPFLPFLKNTAKLSVKQKCVRRTKSRGIAISVL